METPIYDGLYRLLDSSTYGKSTRDECVMLTLRRKSPKLQQCVHGGKKRFCASC